MRVVIIRIILVCVCVFLLAVRNGKCEEFEPDEQTENRKDGKTSLLPGGVRRAVTQSNGNATRDSQLLSLLRARRRQMLSGRLASHINTIASLASKANKNLTSVGEVEVRDSNNSVIQRFTLDNTSSESPSIKVTTANGTHIIQQDLKPQEVKNLFVPKVFQENRSRAGFLNNRRKTILNSRTQDIIEKAIEAGIVYIPPEGLEREVILEPDEEFQVDESNHGLYLLNYSDTDSISPNTSAHSNETNDGEKTPTIESTTVINNLTKSNNENTTIEVEVVTNADVTTSTITSNKVEKESNLEKVETDKDKGNNTLFISDEIYNHFRPLESELPAEEMAPFIYFGQKIGGSGISDNLTSSPLLSASTKSINFIAPPPDKRKFNSRYSATEKSRNISANEEEINEDMDVSVVKNVIEKNKVRNTVKGPAPARHVGLVNAYRRYTSTTISPLSSSPSPVSQLNQTELVIQNSNFSSIDPIKDGTDSNNTGIVKDNFLIKVNTTEGPRNFTRNYLNLRRRPQRVTTSSTEISPTNSDVNSTTEKASTSVYTAVVTSISITSSMKGQNKTDAAGKDVSNSTLVDTISVLDNSTIPKIILVNDTESPTVAPLTTMRNPRHRIRIRTTTTESSYNYSPSSTSSIIVDKPSDIPIASELSNNTSPDLKNEATSRLPERLINLLRQDDYESLPSSTIRPKNILKRRRPTTTTTTTTTSTTPLPTLTTREQSEQPIVLTSETPIVATQATITQSTEVKVTKTTESSRTFVPITATSKTSSESIYRPQIKPVNASILSNTNKTTNNNTGNEIENPTSQNGEVLIEAEKSYTASYVLAGFGVLPVAAIIVFILRNILNKKTKDIDTEYEGYFEDGDIKKESPITPVARPPLPTPTKPDQKWEFPRNKLRLQTLLGQGNFGQVWKAEADDLNGHDGLTRLVAVKTIKETASQKEKQELLHEIYIMQKIGTHPNVVTILACCTEQEPYLLIMEYVMCGKLLTYLRERRSRPDRFSGSGALTSRDLTVFAYCVARGMDYIASKGIVHRDLAARNVLVDHNKLCKIADFGMSRAAGGAARGRHALPVRWMAPEALLYNVYSHQTDVWAFGILLWEIVTLGSTPYAAMSGREVLAAVTEGYRLERPPHCKPQLYRAMHSCWHADPSQRPNFAALKGQLAELLDNEPAEGNYVDLDSFYQESSVYSDPSAIINDEDGLSAEYDRERRCFRELAKGPAKYDNRAFSLHDEELRNKFGIGTPRMGGFGIRDVAFNDRNFSDGEFNERNFPDKSFTERNFPDKNFTERNFPDKNFTERNFPDKNFNDPNFTERKDGKLSTSSFHKERERDRDNPLISRNSFNGFPRIGPRDNHFQATPDGRNKRVSEFECDI